LIENFKKILDIYKTIENIENNNKNLSKLIYEFNRIKKHIEELNSELNNEIKKKENISKNISLVKKVALYTNSRGYYTIKQSENISEMLCDIKNIISSENEIKEELSQIQIIIKELEAEGFTEENLAKAEIFENNILFKEYKDKHPNNLNNFKNYVLSMKTELENKLIPLKDSIKKIEESIESLNSRKKLAQEANKETVNYLNQLEKAFSNIKQLENSINSIKKYFHLSETEDLRLWYTKYNDAVARCQIGLNKIKTSEELSKLYNEKSRQENELQNTKKVIERCEKAIEAFKRLPTLEKAIENFIKNNSKRIEYFFNLLHMPREFTNLEYKDYKIKVKRTSTGEIIDASQMSTGQRASLALALMFTLHSTARNAPKFILLDEPIANMDDMHFLNLIDIVRKFALTGTQIFFTTANPEVAGIFRRKFSFFEDKFKHFKFIRNNNMPTQLYEITYKPNEEMIYAKKLVI